MISSDDASDRTRHRRWTRRGVLGAVGTSVIAVGFAGCLGSGGGSSPESGWKKADSPIEVTLYDAVLSANGPRAFGEGGRVLAQGLDGWQVVVDGGPTGAGNALVNAAATADGRAVWCCGDSGAIGRYALDSGELADYSAPGGMTSSWEGVTVTGRAGHERVTLINGSGELLQGEMRNESVSWGDVQKPVGGLSVGGIAFTPDAGFIADANGDVYRIRDLDSWDQLGIDGENATLHAIDAADGRTATTVGDDGSILAYDGHGWTSVGDAESALYAVDRAGGRGLAGGVGGEVYAHRNTEWEATETQTGKTIHGVALSEAEESGVAVGSDGVILEWFG